MCRHYEKYLPLPPKRINHLLRWFQEVPLCLQMSLWHFQKRIVTLTPPNPMILRGGTMCPPPRSLIHQNRLGQIGLNTNHCFILANSSDFFYVWKIKAGQALQGALQTLGADIFQKYLKNIFQKYLKNIFEKYLKD